MKIVTKKPWWWSITGKNWGEVAMTWGNTVYCAPDKLRDDILVHEAVHIRQNGGKWYKSLWFLIRSTFDDDFYQGLEEEARREQVEFILKK